MRAARAAQETPGRIRSSGTHPRAPTTDVGLCVGPVEKSPLVCEVHLQAQLEGTAGNREALVYGCEDSGRGSGSAARFGKTRTPAGGAVAR